MKELVFFLAKASLLILVAGAFFPLYAKDSVRVVCFAYPPNYIADSHESGNVRKGSIVQVWENYIAPRAGVRIEWIGPVPFSRAMLMLENGEADAIQHLSKTPDRMNRFIFSRKPIMWGRTGLLVRRDEPSQRVLSASDLKSRKIAIIGQGYLPPFLEKNRSALQFEEVYGEEPGERIVRMVVAKRVWGAYFTFPDVLMYYAAKMNKMKDLRIIPYPGSESMETIYAAMSKKADPSLRRRIDSAITAIYMTYDYPAMTAKLLSEMNP